MNIVRVLFTLIILLIAILYFLYIRSMGGPVSPKISEPLVPVEIREYSGERLSSINNLQENSIQGPQVINSTEYQLTIDGLTQKKVMLSYPAVIGGYQPHTKVVTLHCVEGGDATIFWEDVLVKDLIGDAGVLPGANTAIFHARDGYTTSFPLEYIMERDIIMAYHMNNITLPAERGFPFQLVAEDKCGFKWIKWIERIEISGNTTYRGYWEQRGYSQLADVNRSFFE